MLHIMWSVFWSVANLFCLRKNIRCQVNNHIWKLRFLTANLGQTNSSVNLNFDLHYSFRTTKVKCIYSEKATKLFEIFPLLLTTVHTVKSKWKISQNFGPSQNIWTLHRYLRIYVYELKDLFFIIILL